MKIHLTKFYLGIIMIMIFNGNVLGQNNVTIDDENTTQKEVKKDNTPTIAGNLGLGSYHSNSKDGVSSMRIYANGFEVGPFIKGTPIFFTIGWGIDMIDVETKVEKIKYKLEQNELDIPIHAGFMLGDIDEIHLAVRGGVVLNYITSKKVNDEKVDLSGTDRTYWNGTARVSLGYNAVTIFAQYDFSLKSGGDSGIWRFGICLGM